jgi:uncharacterized HAD superfamily protein
MVAKTNKPILPKIALDVDGTIVNANELIFFYYNRDHGTKFDYKGFTSFYCHDIGLDWIRDMAPYYQKVWIDEYKRLAPKVDREILREVTNIYKIDLVTAKKDEPENLTLPALYSWLKINSMEWINVVPVSKLVQKVEFDYQIFIDDAPPLAERVKKIRDKFMFLVDMNYNADVEALKSESEKKEAFKSFLYSRNAEQGRNVIRVKDVNEALRMLRDGYKSNASGVGLKQM